MTPIAVATGSRQSSPKARELSGDDLHAQARSIVADAVYSGRHLPPRKIADMVLEWLVENDIQLVRSSDKNRRG